LSDNYQAGEPGWVYPDLGEPVPERSDAKVHLLAISGLCIQGHWTGDPFYIAWSPLPKRDRKKEALVAQARQAGAEAVRAAEARHTHNSGPATGACDPAGHTP
jgi:hypothetical protein